MFEQPSPIRIRFVLNQTDTNRPFASRLLAKGFSFARCKLRVAYCIACKGRSAMPSLVREKSQDQLDIGKIFAQEVRVAGFEFIHRVLACGDSDHCCVD